MRFAAILNRDGGTLRTTDLDAFSERIHKALGDAGHSVKIEIVGGDQLVDALDSAAKRRSVDAIIAGGGDGTISAAAARLMGSKKALAVLPAGTMNLFARSLGIPLDLDQAIAAFAGAEIRPVDVAIANGRPFIHQFSIGLHANMVQLRDEMPYASRLGKMTASARATWNTLKTPPSLVTDLRIGEAEMRIKTTGVGVTNNLFGEGHLPYADEPDGGVLGVYVTLARERSELVRFAANIMRGRWHTNPHVDVYQGKTISIRIRSSSTKFRCVIDGELTKLDRDTDISINPGALLLLRPAELSSE